MQDGDRGKQIKAARTRAGISQEALAATMGVSVFTVSRYERGAVPVSDERLVQIAYALGLERDAFMEVPA